jgi:hypothetical protein
MNLTKPLTFYLPDSRGVEISRYGKGNLKIGMGVYTYSRLPGHPSRAALGDQSGVTRGTCPGASEECQAICYAARPVAENGPVADMWFENKGDDVPPIPTYATMLRLHVSGDFDTVKYINGWIDRLASRPDVTCWVYTRSWRVPELLPALEQMRRLPNVQMFASMDVSISELPPTGWRRAWIDGDPRAGAPINERAHDERADVKRNGNTFDGIWSFVCPEETGDQPNCETCGYCQNGRKNDVTFLKH